jgi:hypothetical protein
MTNMLNANSLSKEQTCADQLQQVLSVRLLYQYRVGQTLRTFINEHEKHDRTATCVQNSSFIITPA